MAADLWPPRPGSPRHPGGGDFGSGSCLKHDFGDGIKRDRRLCRLAFRVRGAPGKTVGFELADAWRGVSKEARFPLSEAWLEHRIEFEIRIEYEVATTLRFNLPRDPKATFDLADPRLSRAH